MTNDIGMAIVARLLEDVEPYVNEQDYDIKFWLENAGLSLREHKAEVVLITKGRKNTSMKSKVGITTVHSQPALKYLVEMIDQRLNFKSHEKLQQPRHIIMERWRLKCYQIYKSSTHSASN